MFLMFGVSTQAPTFYGLCHVFWCRRNMCEIHAWLQTSFMGGGEKNCFPDLNVRASFLEESGFQHQLVVGSSPWTESPGNSRCEMVWLLVGNNYQKKLYSRTSFWDKEMWVVNFSYFRLSILDQIFSHQKNWMLYISTKMANYRGINGSDIFHCCITTLEYLQDAPKKWWLKRRFAVGFVHVFVKMKDMSGYSPETKELYDIPEDSSSLQHPCCSSSHQPQNNFFKRLNITKSSRPTNSLPSFSDLEDEKDMNTCLRFSYVLHNMYVIS